jgi:hypothetical protein
VAHLQNGNKGGHRRWQPWPIPAIADGEAVVGRAKKVGSVEGCPIWGLVRLDTHQRLINGVAEAGARGVEEFPQGVVEFEDGLSEPRDGWSGLTSGSPR